MMINVNSIVRIRCGVRKGQLAEVIDTNFKHEETPLPLRRFHVRFAVDDSDWYEASTLEELPSAGKVLSKRASAA